MAKIKKYEKKIKMGVMSYRSRAPLSDERKEPSDVVAGISPKIVIPLLEISEKAHLLQTETADIDDACQRNDGNTS